MRVTKRIRGSREQNIPSNYYTSSNNKSVLYFDLEGIDRSWDFLAGVTSLCEFDRGGDLFRNKLSFPNLYGGMVLNLYPEAQSDINLLLDASMSVFMRQHRRGSNSFYLIVGPRHPDIIYPGTNAPADEPIRANTPPPPPVPEFVVDNTRTRARLRAEVAATRPWGAWEEQIDVGARLHEALRGRQVPNPEPINWIDPQFINRPDNGGN